MLGSSSCLADFSQALLAAYCGASRLMRVFAFILIFLSFGISANIADERSMKTEGQKLKDTEITIEKLRSAGKEDAIWVIYDYVVLREPNIITADSLSSFPRQIQLVYAAYNADVDLVNGGLEQYYFNNYGPHAEIAVEGLRAVGAIQTSDILRRANKLKKSSNIVEVDKSESTLDDFFAVYDENDEMAKLNNELMDIEEEVMPLLKDYIWNNLEEFVPASND